MITVEKNQLKKVLTNLSKLKTVSDSDKTNSKYLVITLQDGKVTLSRMGNSNNVVNATLPDNYLSNDTQAIVSFDLFKKTISNLGSSDISIDFNSPITIDVNGHSVIRSVQSDSMDDYYTKDIDVANCNKVSVTNKVLLEIISTMREKVSVDCLKSNNLTSLRLEASHYDGQSFLGAIATDSISFINKKYTEGVNVELDEGNIHFNLDGFFLASLEGALKTNKEGTTDFYVSKEDKRDVDIYACVNNSDVPSYKYMFTYNFNNYVNYDFIIESPAVASFGISTNMIRQYLGTLNLSLKNEKLDKNKHFIVIGIGTKVGEVSMSLFREDKLEAYKTVFLNTDEPKLYTDNTNYDSLLDGSVLKMKVNFHRFKCLLDSVTDDRLEVSIDGHVHCVHLDSGYNKYLLKCLLESEPVNG